MLRLLFVYYTIACGVVPRFCVQCNRSADWFDSVRLVRSFIQPFASSSVCVCASRRPVGRTAFAARRMCVFLNDGVAARGIASCSVGYVAVIRDATGCRAWSRSADDGRSAATISCCLAPFCFTSTCSSECLFLFFSVFPSTSFEHSFELNINVEGSKSNDGNRMRKKGRRKVERLFKNFTRVIFSLFLTL